MRNRSKDIYETVFFQISTAFLHNRLQKKRQETHFAKKQTITWSETIIEEETRG